VFLLALPAVRVQDAFVKPLVDQDMLEMQVTVCNDTEAEQTVTVGGTVHAWINQAGSDVTSAPEPRWKLDDAAMTLPRRSVTVKPGQTTTVTLRQQVAGRLKLWSPGSPNLYAAVLSVQDDSRTIDKHFARFGWRQFTIDGGKLLLNGRKIQLSGDLLHPFGPFTMSRRYVWAWYKMIQDFGGNCVRPHAQIHPRHYVDLADEMGLVVLDESALFGSSIALNFEEPSAWRRFAEHIDGLVLRDRNHPSVVGWSFGNELFAIFNLNRVSQEDTDRWYRQLGDLGLRTRRLDPTRPWLSCDGDDDLRGVLPVWSKHFGHGTPLDRLPELDKPLMVGESGGTYYARPSHLAMFNGPKAFESYAGRNEALAIDLYDNIVRMARPRLAYYSASETAWFGLEHLNFGYHDYSRLPDASDGVFFTRPFEEGKPGMQIERLPPYVATLNPGWDSRLPLYRPLAMFHAQQAALAVPSPQPCDWDHRHVAASSASKAQAERSTIDKVAFIGDPQAALGRRLSALGVPLAATVTTGEPGMTIIDADRLSDAARAEARQAIRHLSSGGMVLLMAGGVKESPANLAEILPARVEFTDRTATMLANDQHHAWTAGLASDNLYFAEDGQDRFILRHGMEGPIVEKGHVLLSASNTDWSLFNEAPEYAKCAAIVLGEHMARRGGAALVEYDHGKGKLVLSTIDYRKASRSADAMWRKLMANMGVKLLDAKESMTAAFNDDGALVNALSIGRFSAKDLDAALAKDFLGKITSPHKGSQATGLAWLPVHSPSNDRFILQELNQKGPDEAFAVYFSYWIKSPRALDDLLTGGPDAPHFTTVCFVSEKCRVFLNGQELAAATTEPADYRTRLVFEGVPLKKGWNHFLIKVVSNRLAGDRPGTLAVRISTNNPEYGRQLETAVEQ
jgi:beta-galactosidase